MKENYLACKNAIENVIKKHFDGYHLNKEAVTEILSQYDMDCVSFVLAYTLHSKYWDGRFSKDNKEWGKCYLMHEEVLKECIVDSHPAVLNGFVDLLRQKVEEQEELVYWFQMPGNIYISRLHVVVGMTIHFMTKNSKT